MIRRATRIAQELRKSYEQDGYKPDGNCRYFSEVLVRKLAEAKINSCLVLGIVRCDRVNSYGKIPALHWWVELDYGKEPERRNIIDVTADQFNRYINGKAFPPVYVTTNAKAERHDFTAIVIVGDKSGGIQYRLNDRAGEPVMIDRAGKALPER